MDYADIEAGGERRSGAGAVPGARDEQRGFTVGTASMAGWTRRSSYD